MENGVLEVRDYFKTYDVITGNLGYQENKTWIQKLINEGYTVFDIGDPTDAHLSEGISAFYDMEINLLFGVVR